MDCIFKSLSCCIFPLYCYLSCISFLCHFLKRFCLGLGLSSRIIIINASIAMQKKESSTDTLRLTRSRKLFIHVRHKSLLLMCFIFRFSSSFFYFSILNLQFFLSFTTIVINWFFTLYFLTRIFTARTELYICGNKSCEKTYRFPRYNDVSKVTDYILFCPTFIFFMLVNHHLIQVIFHKYLTEKRTTKCFGK